MKNIAIIPARGGSKRIPRKNIKLFMGKPIIAYSIEVAIKSGLFDEVMVSTDDDEIADIAKVFGASVPFMRSKETANDFATLADVIEEVVVEYKKQEREFDNVCCILATAPLLNYKDIVVAYDKLNSTECTSVFPIVEFSYPILRSLKMNEDGFIAMNWPEYERTRSQDLEPAYHDSGTFYWHKLSNWKSDEQKRIGIIVDPRFIQDIDNESDWKLAELKYKLLMRNIN